MEVNGVTREYVEVELGDIELANELVEELPGFQLDNLSVQTMKVLESVRKMVSEACRSQDVLPDDYCFTRRQVQDFTSLSETQVRLHVKRLQEAERLVVVRGGRGKVYEYQLVSGADQSSKPLGLVEPGALQHDYDASLAD